MAYPVHISSLLLPEHKETKADSLVLFPKTKEKTAKKQHQTLHPPITRLLVI